ncbi:MAG: NADP-dependent oxidoreductase [Pseudomonadales bacterium]|nr:NADP-dependent oxidoreductase [Pseudomonadales bacterium]
MQSKAVYLKSRPAGKPVAANFELVDVEVGEPGEGQILVENIYMSVDPYMRGRMREAWGPGDSLMGGAIGRVISSGASGIKEGDFVSHGMGWRQHVVVDAATAGVVDPALAPLSSYLGVMGMPGLTAYGGLLVTGEYKDGESVFVSAASGAVGSVVGQIARIKGSREVIGSAGSDAKVAMLTEEFGFSHGFNYKTSDPLEELRKGAPKGIDIYFENVGGPQLEAALTHMRPYGRIPICGMIAHYNDGDSMTPGPRNLTETIYKFVTLRGFVVSAFAEHEGQFRQDMGGWIRSGDLKYHETISEGIENAPTAFMGLFEGANEGKMLVRLAADPTL